MPKTNRPYPSIIKRINYKAKSKKHELKSQEQKFENAWELIDFKIEQMVIRADYQRSKKVISEWIRGHTALVAFLMPLVVAFLDAYMLAKENE